MDERSALSRSPNMTNLLLQFQLIHSKSVMTVCHDQFVRITQSIRMTALDLAEFRSSIVISERRQSRYGKTRLKVRPCQVIVTSSPVGERPGTVY